VYAAYVAFGAWAKLSHGQIFKAWV